MKDIKVNKNNDDYHKRVIADEVDVSRGSTQDILKARKERYNMVADEVEKFFKDYDGGGLAIIMNVYDENNNVTGNRVAIFGADDIDGIIKLQKGIDKASEDLVESTVKSISAHGPEAVIAFIAALARNGEFDDKKNSDN